MDWRRCERTRRNGRSREFLRVTAAEQRKFFRLISRHRENELEQCDGATRTTLPGGQLHTGTCLRFRVTVPAPDSSAGLRRARSEAFTVTATSGASNANPSAPVNHLEPALELGPNRTDKSQQISILRSASRETSSVRPGGPPILSWSETYGCPTA
jgi:hypothetical protein